MKCKCPLIDSLDLSNKEDIKKAIRQTSKAIDKLFDRKKELEEQLEIKRNLRKAECCGNCQHETFSYGANWTNSICTLHNKTHNQRQVCNDFVMKTSQAW